MENEGCHAVIFFSVSLCTRIYICMCFVLVVCIRGQEMVWVRTVEAKIMESVSLDPFYAPQYSFRSGEDWAGIDPFLCIYVCMWTGLIWLSSGRGGLVG